MKIVIVDHIYLEEEHIKKLRSFSDLEIFEEPPKKPDELKERIRAADIVIVGWTNLTKNIIDSAKKLKMISIWATTCHYVDLEAARERGIVVTHVPGYATEAVAEHAFALLLAAIRRLPSADKHVRTGDFDWRPFGGSELAGKTLGIIGTGAIGCRVAEIAKAFKMQILGYDKYPNLKKAEEIGMKYVDLYALLKESDFITLHVSLTSETERLIGKKEIEAMKKGAVIINTSQGKVINEKDLINALKSSKLSYAGLDVFEEEPPAKGNPLFKLDNVILSPHIGFHTVEAAKRCTDICIDNVVKFLERHPQNVC
ncbi:MAG: 2-hydroxyacid dehydrogenase [Candidatus Bathyarchaeota archaeon]|nr:2-hydroxyacid dehydrogenase [Candidatus Bathyarchaeota archaeon]